MEHPKSLFFFFFFSFLFLCGILGLSSAATIQEKCSQELTKMMNCLDYSTGKAAMPSQSCCSSTKDMRTADPVCLCFFIQQAYEGVPTIKQLGIKVDRLLQLPTDCKLANTNTTDCPKLLNLSPTSPDYALFTNSSTVKTNSNSGNSSSQNANGCMPNSHFGSSAIMAMIVAAFFSMFSI